MHIHLKALRAWKRSNHKGATAQHNSYKYFITPLYPLHLLKLNIHENKFYFTQLNLCTSIHLKCHRNTLQQQEEFRYL